VILSNISPTRQCLRGEFYQAIVDRSRREDSIRSTTWPPPREAVAILCHRVSRREPPFVLEAKPSPPPAIRIRSITAWPKSRT